jgi:hypothetical protein
LVDGNRVHKTDPLTKQSAVSTWQLDEAIELWVIFTSGLTTSHLLIPSIMAATEYQSTGPILSRPSG